MKAKQAANSIIKTITRKKQRIQIAIRQMQEGVRKQALQKQILQKQIQMVKNQASQTQILIQAKQNI